jgi:uroporphyrinogen decarboxylase
MAFSAAVKFVGFANYLKLLTTPEILYSFGTTFLYAILHTDGDINPCLEDLASSGIHALQAIDPVAGMDIRDMRRVGGKVCLCGNMHCGLLLTGPARRVYEEARRLLQNCMAGGGFVLGASNAVFPETPIEHYRAMIRAWEDGGQYGTG